MRRLRDDGNISILSLGFLVVIMMMVLVTVAATAVHIQHLRLTHLADELAIDAADALDLEAYYRGEVAPPRAGAAVALSPSRMEDEVLGHLQHRASQKLEGVQVVSVTSPDGNTAVVTVTMMVHPIIAVEPLLPFLDGIPLTATSSARHF